MLPWMRRWLAPLSLACMAAIAVPRVAHAARKDPEERAERKAVTEITPRGAQIELLPAAAICLPSLVFKCKLAGIGQTGPFVGGGFTLGFRAERHAMFGVSYNGAALRPDYNLPDRRYETYGHMHHVVGMFKVMLPIRRWEISTDVGAGWSYLLFPVEGGGKVFSHGFVAKIGPAVDVYINNHFFMGLKADFLINVHGKTCREGLTPIQLDPEVPPVDPNVCIKRNAPEAKSEQLPVHLVLPGIHFGFVI
jgi:hypothetical protein